MPAPSGRPIYPTEDSAPTAGSAEGNYSFARQVVIWQVYNKTGQTCYCKIQGDSSDPASETNFDFTVATGETPFVGSIPITRMSVWFHTGATIQAIEPISGTDSGTATFGLLGWTNASDIDNFA